MPSYLFYLIAIILPGSAFSQFSDTSTAPSNRLVISLNVIPAGSAIITWRNDQDISSGFFVVERRSDSGSFEIMVSIKVSTQSSDYKVLDEKPYPGINYYRIKLVNAEGLFSYSPTVSGDMSLVNFCKFYPNPADDHLIVSSRRQVEIRIFNKSGVLSLSKVLNKGLAAVDVSSLPKGIYILTISSTDTKTTMREILYKN